MLREGRRGSLDTQVPCRPSFGLRRRREVMGTNYYLRPKHPAKVKTFVAGVLAEERDDYSWHGLYASALPGGFAGDAEIVFSRADGEMGLHLCKLSLGWVPLFEHHPGTALGDWEGVKRCLGSGEFDVLDEDGEVQAPEEFTELVEGWAHRWKLKTGREAASHRRYGATPDPDGARIEWQACEFV